MNARNLFTGLVAAAAMSVAIQLSAADSVIRAAAEPAGLRDTETKADEPEIADAVKFLTPGEVLVFRLSWGIFSNAGELRIETTRENTPEGPRIRVKIHTESKGMISAFYDLDTDSDSLIDPETGRALRIEHQGQEGSREAHTVTVFDYEKMEVTHTDYKRAYRNGTAKLPDDRPAYDVYMAIMLARTWNMEPGDTRKQLSVFEDDIYELEATALGTETLKVPAGRFEVVEIELKQLGELKGFFKKGGTMRFFISRGEKPQIVRIELRAKAGTFVMQLKRVEHKDPAPQPAAANP